MMAKLADDVASFAGQKTRFERDKGDGISRLDNGTRRRPGLGIEPGWNIQRDNRRRKWFACSIRLTTLSRGAFVARTKQTIDN